MMKRTVQYSNCSPLRTFCWYDKAICVALLILAWIAKNSNDFYNSHKCNWIYSRLYIEILIITVVTPKIIIHNILKLKCIQGIMRELIWQPSYPLVSENRLKWNNTINIKWVNILVAWSHYQFRILQPLQI